MATQRGRKSTDAADLAVIDGGRSSRPAPPGDLNEYEASRWASVVGEMPDDWFSESTADLLRGYCKHAWIIHKIDEAITAAGDDLEVICKLGEKRDKQTRVLMSLATKMRITNQSTVDPLKAGRKKRNEPTGQQPWES